MDGDSQQSLHRNYTNGVTWYLADRNCNTVEPHYNEDLGTMKITLLYQVSHYIKVQKQRNIKSWDQQNYLVIRGFCYIRPLYNEVPLYIVTNDNIKTLRKLYTSLVLLLIFLLD